MAGHNCICFSSFWPDLFDYIFVKSYQIEMRRKCRGPRVKLVHTMRTNPQFSKNQKQQGVRKESYKRAEQIYAVKDVIYMSPSRPPWLPPSTYTLSPSLLWKSCSSLGREANVRVRVGLFVCVCLCLCVADGWEESLGRMMTSYECETTEVHYSRYIVVR